MNPCTKRYLVSTVIWSTVSVLWTVLMIMKIVSGDDLAPILLNGFTALASLVCAIMNLVNFCKNRKKDCSKDGE